MIDWAREHKRCQIWGGTGIGKTSAMEFYICLLKMLGEIGDDPVLVLAPANVARDTWPEDIARWEQFKDMTIMPLTGEPHARRDKLKCRADIFTCSYNLAPWLVEQYMDRWPFRTVIADESDQLASFREKRGGVGLNTKKAAKAGKRAHHLGMVAHNLCDRWINLTGTPSGAGYHSLWGPQWFIDRGAALGRTYSAYMQRWFKPKWSGYGTELMPYSEQQILEALRDTCITVDPRDYYDLKEPIVTPIKVKLPPAARKIYNELEKELFAELEDGWEVEVNDEGSLTNKCLQIANGAIYTEHPNWSPIHDAKLEALGSIVRESGGTPILVAYSFKFDIPRIKKAFPGAVELSRPDGMRAFKSGNAQVGIAHPESVGYGTDGLQNVTNILVRYGHNWKRNPRTQMLERIGPMRQLQAGLDRPVWVYDLIAEDTVDEAVISAHAASWVAQDALMNYMKRKKA
jgi:hypothetical protein